MKRVLKLAVLGALVVGAVKMAATKRHFMAGTEEELRARVRSKFGERVPADKLREVEDKVVGFARRKGTVVDPAPSDT